MASAFGTTYRFRQPGTPGKVLRFALFASSAILVVTGVAALVRASDAGSWRVTFVIPPEGSAAQPTVSSLYPGSIGGIVWAGTGAAVVVALIWVVWQYRAHENLWAFGGQSAPKMKPGMAVMWWFIPLANWWMPFTAVRELRSSSAARAGSRRSRAGPVLGVWWACWLAAAFVGIATAIWPWASIVAEVVDRGEPFEGVFVVDLGHVLWLVGVWHLLLAAAAVSASFVVADIERSQAAMASGGVVPTDGVAAPLPPRPDLG
jgi:hypothetical protein